MKGKENLFKFGKGWGIILFCLLMFWFYAGMVNDSTNIVAPAVAQKLGVSPGTVISMGTLSAFVAVIFFFIFGALNRRISARYLSFICLIIAGIGYFSMGHSNSLLMYAIALCATTSGAMSAGYIAGGSLVAQWFPKKKGIVMGYTTMGHNLATGFFVPLISFLVTRLGVENAVIIPSVLVVILAIFGLTFVKNTPKEIGLYPDNVTKEIFDKEYFHENIDSNGGWTVKKLFKRPTFWLVAVTSGGFQLVSTIIITQLVVRNMEVGFSQLKAVSIMTILAFAGLIGSWLIGYLDQKMGTKKAMMIFGVWYAIALLLNFTNNIVLIYIFLVMFAICLGGSANFTTSLPASVFGRHGFEKVNSVLFPIQALVSSFGFLVNGSVLNATGSLRFSYIIAAIAAIVNVLLLIFIKEHKYNRDFMSEKDAESLTKSLELEK